MQIAPGDDLDPRRNRRWPRPWRPLARSKPGCGNLAGFLRDRLAFLTECSRTYGDMVSLRLGPSRIIQVNHPDFIEQVLVTHNASFRKHFALRSILWCSATACSRARAIFGSSNGV